MNAPVNADPGMSHRGEGNESMESTASPDAIARTYRGKAFASEGPGTYRVLVTSDGDVLVWDSLAGHFTRCHSLSAVAQARLRAQENQPD